MEERKAGKEELKVEKNNHRHQKKKKKKKKNLK